MRGSALPSDKGERALVGQKVIPLLANLARSGRAAVPVAEENQSVREKEAPLPSAAGTDGKHAGIVLDKDASPDLTRFTCAKSGRDGGYGTGRGHMFSRCSEVRPSPLTPLLTLPLRRAESREHVFSRGRSARGIPRHTWVSCPSASFCCAGSIVARSSSVSLRASIAPGRLSSPVLIRLLNFCDRLSQHRT